MEETRRMRVARHLFFHRSSDALFLFEPGGRRVLDANPAARRLSGFDAAELRAMTLEGLFAATAPDGLERLADPSSAAWAGAFDPPRPGYRLRRRQGGPIAVCVGVGAIADDGDARPLGLAVVRAADAATTDTGAAALDRFFADTPELFGVATYGGLILQINAAWERALGYRADALVGTSLWDLIHPEVRAACGAAARDLSRGGTATLEVRMRHRDGTDRWISWSVASLDGRLVAVGRDVTDQRRLVAALAQAREAADAADRAKTEFLAGMSHEIRTPLTAILGFADLLAERWRRSAAPDAAVDREALQAIKRNGDLLLGLITDILDLAKIEADRTRLAPSPCSPAQVVADVTALMRVRAEAQGLALHVEFLTPIPATIHTDALRLRQVLIHLIGNAIKFTDRGSVRLRVRLVDDDEGEPERALRFEVVDTGIGLPDDEDDIPRLFQPFFRVDGSPTRRHGGAGLGLALVHRLTERLGGTITAQGRAEGGSTFTLTLPAGPVGTVAIAPAAVATPAPPPAPAPAPAPAPPPAPAVAVAGSVGPKRSCRVLLAEDNRDTQRVMTLRLAAAGIEVTPAPNGQVAVDLALSAREAGRPFDVILMDMQMPVLDGYEATRTLRGFGYRHPIIAVTAHALSEDRDECLRFGCDDYLSKPIDWSRLTTLIASHARAAPASPQRCA